MRTILPWRQRKGLKPANGEECRKLYSYLWDYYIAENPDLLDILKQASGLSDFYGKKGHACQATELWRIRNRTEEQVKEDRIYAEFRKRRREDNGLSAASSEVEHFVDIEEVGGSIPPPRTKGSGR